MKETPIAHLQVTEILDSDILIEPYQECGVLSFSARVCAYDGCRSSGLGGWTWTRPSRCDRKPALEVEYSGALPDCEAEADDDLLSMSWWL